MRTFVRPDQPVLELEVEEEDGSTETFKVTGEHPFWVKARGWVEAADLKPGDEIFTSNGGWLRVASGTWLSQRQTVYNFEVEDFHTYFVGEAGAWVHNTCAADPRAVNRVAPKKGPRKTKAGTPRKSAPTHWKKNKNRPDISPENRKLIDERRSPKVDEQWTKFHPEDAPFKGDTIELHHVDYGPELKELPQARHRGRGYYKDWHR
jgi:hypothetical protein